MSICFLIRGNMEIIRLISAKVLEPIYFSLFLIYGKDLKHKRLLLTFIMIFEYVLLKEFIKFNVWFQFIYTFMTFVNLKVLYKEKAQVTDIFLFAVASIVLIIISAIVFLMGRQLFESFYIAIFINRFLLFSFVLLFKDRIHHYYKKFCSLWNRHNSPKVIKSLTLRNISVIAFNLMFYTINAGMIYYVTHFR